MTSRAISEWVDGFLLQAQVSKDRRVSSVMIGSFRLLSCRTIGGNAREMEDKPEMIGDFDVKTHLVVFAL
jgi:hypothetical protein